MRGVPSVGICTCSLRIVFTAIPLNLKPVHLCIPAACRSCSWAASTLRPSTASACPCSTSSARTTSTGVTGGPYTLDCATLTHRTGNNRFTPAAPAVPSTTSSLLYGCHLITRALSFPIAPPPSAAPPTPWEPSLCAYPTWCFRWLMWLGWLAGWLVWGRWSRQLSGTASALPCPALAVRTLRPHMCLCPSL